MKFSRSVIMGVGFGVALSALAPVPAASAADMPFGGGAKAPPAAEPFVLDPDGVSFGSNAEAVARLYDAWWDKRFVPRYRKVNPGPKMQELDYELAARKRVLRRVTNFDGRSATFDKADFREEFAHGNGESMTSAELVRRGNRAAGVNSEAYTRRFFFFQDRLWKTYDEYQLEPNALLGADFKEAVARVEASLGPGVKRTRSAESKLESVTFEAGKQRVRVVKLAPNRVAVVRMDNALAREVLDRRTQTARAPEPALDPETESALR